MAEVLKTNNMKKGPFKMKKGSPMERNFGISPMKDVKKSKIYNEEHQNEFDHVGKFNDKHVPKKK